jgi:hypothetical protein
VTHALSECIKIIVNMMFSLCQKPIALVSCRTRHTNAFAVHGFFDFTLFQEIDQAQVHREQAVHYRNPFSAFHSSHREEGTSRSSYPVDTVEKETR